MRSAIGGGLVGIVLTGLAWGVSRYRALVRADLDGDPPYHHPGPVR